MKSLRFLLPLVLISNLLSASSIFQEKQTRISRHQEYLDFYESYPRVLKDQGSKAKGEIEIVLDLHEISKCEKSQYDRLRQDGYSHDESFKASRAGLIAEDRYWVFLRDPVIFPSGAYGLYNRIIWKSSLDGPAGVAILPKLSDGRILLILNYRHATRQWELEIPRGIRNKGESEHDAAMRELREETGSFTDHLDFLGVMNTCSGLTNTQTPIYLAHTGKVTNPSQDFSEAIKGTIAFTPAEIKLGLSRGFLEFEHNGKKKRCSLRDSYLSFGLLIAEEKGLL